MSEMDLLVEMQQLMEGGKTLVLARNGVLIKVETERGVQPLVAAYDAGLLKGSIVFDRAVGRAAAAFYAAGKAREVHTLLAGAGAEELCKAAGVKLVTAKTVPRILNRDRSASCPMEQAAEELKDTGKIMAAVRAALERMNGK